MDAFVHDSPMPRVVFGAGSLAKVPGEVERLGAARVLLIATGSQRHAADELARQLGQRLAGRLDRVAEHVPVELAREAGAHARAIGADLVLALGGGSAIGLAKALALEPGLAIFAVPTTYAGSEMTSIYGLTEAGRKRTGRDPKVLPRTVVYDPELTQGLPLRLAGPSGMNAIAHAVEALYAEDAGPLTALIAQEAVRTLADSLRAIAARPEDRAGRERALYGAWLAGHCLASAAMALHHKLCHTLGGSFGLPHAQTHAVLLPHAVAYNRRAAPGAMAALGRALGADDPAAALFDLARDLGTPAGLRELGMREADLEPAADLALESRYPNPRPLTREDVRLLLDDAFHGRPPRAD